MIRQVQEEDLENTKILMVDDQVLSTELLQRTLASEPGMEVAGVAHDAHSPNQLAEASSPDVVLMDVELPGGNGRYRSRHTDQASLTPNGHSHPLDP